MKTAPQPKTSSEYWQWSGTELLAALNSSADNGLSNQVAAKKLLEYGQNEFLDLHTKAWGPILLSQFKNTLIIILIGISIFSFFVSEHLNGSIILLMVLINAFVGFWQEFRAEKSLAKLKKLISYEAKVKRNGQLRKLDTKDLVPGDIVLLNIGDIVPADLKLLRSKNLVLNESVLTGESLPVEKGVTTKEVGTTPQELKGAAFLGSSVLTGSAIGLVVYTGKLTFLGKSIDLSKYNLNQITNFEKNLAGFSKNLLRIVLALSILVTTFNLLLGRELVISLLFGVTLALGLTPEVLPIIITIAISNAANKLAKKKVIVRRLSALEDLGNIDILCTDKTGTLTEGKLQLVDYMDEKGARSEEVLLDGLLCNASNPALQESILGNSIDQTIWDNLTSRRYHQQASSLKLLDYLNFDFKTQRMAVLLERPQQNLLLFKGSFSAISKLCSSKLSLKQQTNLADLVEEYESKGYRVICLASMQTDITQIEEAHLPTNCRFSGFLVFTDPLKPKLHYIFSQLQSLQVQLKIITGDSATITRSVCEQAGMTVQGSQIITGSELAALDKKVLVQTVKEHNIFARVTPEQKNEIISLLQSTGHVVAYLGDGINDVGALTKADVGISVNNALDVAKDSADIILLEKNLNALIRGIQEGRKTFNNTWKFIINTMSSSFGNILTIGISSIFLKFFPLLPTQVLLIDSTSDIQHLTVSTDNVDKELLKKPQKWDHRFIWKFMVIFGLISAVFDLLIILPMVFWKLPESQFQTILFVSSVTTETLAFFSIRTKRWFWQSKTSKLFLLTSLLAVAIAVLFPMLQITRVFLNFSLLDTGSWIFIWGVTLAYFFALEIGKKLFYRWESNSKNSITRLAT